MFRLPSAVPVGPPGRKSLPRSTRLSGHDDVDVQRQPASNAPGGPRAPPPASAAAFSCRARRAPRTAARSTALLRGRLFGAAAALDRPLGRDDLGQRLLGVRIVEQLQDPIDFDRAPRPAARRRRARGRRSSPVIFSAACTWTSPSSLSSTSKLSESMLTLTPPSCRSWTASSPGNAQLFAMVIEQLGIPGSCTHIAARSSIRVVRPVNVPPAAGTLNAAVLDVDEALQRADPRPDPPRERQPRACRSHSSAGS